MSKISLRFPFARTFSQLLRMILPLAALMISSRPATAQNAGIAEGSRVQIATPGAKRVSGIVRSVTADSTTIFVDGDGGIRRFLNSDVTDLRVSRGKTALAGAKRGAIWGGGMGTALAIVALVTPEPDQTYGNHVSNDELALDMFLAGLLWGTGIGALVRAEHWDVVPLRTRTSALSGSVGLSVAFSPSFLH